MRRAPSFIRRISEAEMASHPAASWLRTIILCVCVSVLTHLMLPRLRAHYDDVVCHVDVFTPLCHMQPSNVPDPPVAARRALSKHHISRISHIEEPLPVEIKPHHEDWAVIRTDAKLVSEECVDPTREQEALAALTQARANRNRGHHKKAGVIIEHALALLPSHPDILTEYGLHLEKTRRVVEADGYCVRALSVNPRHSEALACRARTEPIVTAIDEEMLARLKHKRDRFILIPRSSTLRRAMRESYFMHIYHTVAIEGNTLSLGETRSILETGMGIAGKSIREHNEVIGMDLALRFLNHSLIHLADITLDDILEMHRRVLGFASPLDAGRLRDTQVYVGRFTPVAPQYVKEQMVEFVEWLNDPLLSDMDPVQKAAIAHYKLVVVHPFVDGNGRTARLLLNLILMKAGFPPIILPVETRAEYFATLHTANMGDLRPFVRYVARHVDDTLQQYINLVSTSSCDTAQCELGASEHN